MSEFNKIVNKYTKINEVAPLIGLVGRAAALKAADELEKLRKKKFKNSKLNFVDEISSEEEVEIMADINCREYKENDYVSLKNGGEGNIIKIIYVVIDNEDEVLFLKKCDLGNHTTKDL